MEGHRGFRDRPALLLQPSDPGDQVDAAAWCFFFEEEEEEKEEEDETHDYEVPIPLLFLMAGSACWLRILLFGKDCALSLSLVRCLCVYCRCDPFCALQCGVLFVDSGSGMSQAGFADFHSRSVPFFVA